MAEKTVHSIGNGFIVSNGFITFLESFYVRAFDLLLIAWFIVFQVSLILPSQERSLFVKYCVFND